MKNRTRLKRRIDKMAKYHFIQLMYNGKKTTYTLGRHCVCNSNSVFYVDPRIKYANMIYHSLKDLGE